MAVTPLLRSLFSYFSIKIVHFREFRFEWYTCMKQVFLYWPHEPHIDEQSTQVEPGCVTHRSSRASRSSRSSRSYHVYPPTLQLILCLGWRLTSGVEMDDNSYVLLGADTSYLLPSTSDASYLLPSTSDASYLLPSTSDTSYLFPSTSDTSYGSILLTSPRSIKNQGTQKNIYCSG